jgi:hypothetical protein
MKDERYWRARAKECRIWERACLWSDFDPDISRRRHELSEQFRSDFGQPYWVAFWRP